MDSFKLLLDAKVKIANLESNVKTQSAEIQHLKNQLAESTKQLKEMAVSVIEGGSELKKSS